MQYPRQSSPRADSAERLILRDSSASTGETPHRWSRHRRHASIRDSVADILELHPPLFEAQQGTALGRHRRHRGKTDYEEEFDGATMDACLIAAGHRANHDEMAASARWSRGRARTGAFSQNKDKAATGAR